MYYIFCNKIFFSIAYRSMEDIYNNLREKGRTDLVLQISTYFILYNFYIIL